MPRRSTPAGNTACRSSVGRVKNVEELTAGGTGDLRRIVLGIVEAGLGAVDPIRAVERTLSLDGEVLIAAGREYDLKGVRNVVLLGAGKASLGIAAGVEEVLGERISGGAVVVRKGQARPLRWAEVIEAGHPVPDNSSLEGAMELMTLASAAGPEDLIIACFTGGSSALAAYPAWGITLEEKRELNRLLLGSGAGIEEINAVRKHVSRVKGGRLARLASPARILNLTVSDVADDPEDLITDPTVQDTSATADAIRVLRDHSLWDEVAPSIREHLQGSPEAASPDISGVDVHTVMMVTGETACEAMAQEARQEGLEPVVLTTALEGESREVGKVLATLARECARKSRPFPAPCALIGCGGETTVTLSKGGRFHLGGPNQEAALSFALGLDPSDRVAAAFLDTDGADGGTDFAGAVVDATTALRAARNGLDPRATLRAHEASKALGDLGELVSTGSTQTNINDMFAIVVGS